MIIMPDLTQVHPERLSLKNSIPPFPHRQNQNSAGPYELSSSETILSSLSYSCLAGGHMTLETHSSSIELPFLQSTSVALFDSS